MGGTPELSCIIITLNEEEYLPFLLTSLKNQTFKNFEVIVSDFNSKDKTREIAKKFGCRITNGGSYSVGRNNGARIARGKYLLFLDADCILPKNFLESNLEEFKKSNKGAGTTPVKPISDKIIDKIFFSLYNFWSILMSKISPHCAGCSIFVKKSVFKKLNGFNEKVVFAENLDFSRRAKKYGFVNLPAGIYTSVRRMDKDGRLKFMSKYIFAELYRLFYKEINNSLFEYESTN